MCEVINPKNLMSWNSANLKITFHLQTLGLGQVLLDISSENWIKSRRQRVVTEATRKHYPNYCRTVKFPINYKDQNHNQTRKRESRTPHIKKKGKPRHAAKKLAPENKNTRFYPSCAEGRKGHERERERESRDEVTREEGGLLTRGKDSRANAWQDQVKRGRIAGEAHECAEARPTA